MIPFPHPCCRLKKICPAFFRWDFPVVKISPEWVTGPEQLKSRDRIATFSLWTGMFRDGISSIPGETVISLWLIHRDTLWMPRNRLPRVMKYYSPTGRRNHGRPSKRLLDTWDRNGSTSGPTPWEIYDDDDTINSGTMLGTNRSI